MGLLSSVDFFVQLTLSRNLFRKAIRVSSSLNLVQDQSSVSHNLGPTCLQKLSAYDKGGRLQGKGLLAYLLNITCL